MNQNHFIKNFSLLIISLMSSSIQASFPNNETEKFKKSQIKQEHVNNDYLVEIMEDDINPFEIKTEDEPDKNNIDFKEENMGNGDENEDNTINIIIDSFPKAFIEENGSHAHSGVHEKYWVPQKETIQTIIKSLKEEKTICANGKNYFLKPKDIDQGVAIHRILAEIYYASDKNDKKQFTKDKRNMVNALKRLDKTTHKSAKKKNRKRITRNG